MLNKLFVFVLFVFVGNDGISSNLKNTLISLRNIYNRKIRARGQFYESYYSLWFQMCFVYAQIVHMHANQLIPQLSMKQSDTLPTQYRHIEYLHEEVWCQKNNY